MKDLRTYRDLAKLVGAIVFFWLYIPHITVYFTLNTHRRELIKSDLWRMRGQVNLNLAPLMLLLYFLHTNRYYRCLFYYRIGAILAMLIGWYRPGDRYFKFSHTSKVGKAVWFAHPYGTILNAQSIGDNFSCLHLTTIGDIGGKRPVIGNNVSLGANVTILGDVVIGDNVTVGAGSVVVKSVPSNCIVAGVPARIIKKLSLED